MTPAYSPSTQLAPPSPENRLGLLYRHEAGRLPWRGPIFDVHTHINGIEAARLFFDVADAFGVQRVWTMCQLEEVDAMQAEFGDRLSFIAVPNYATGRTKADTFTTDWLRRIEKFAEKGAKLAKFWAAPRGRDFHPDLQLDTPIRREGMKLARSLGMMFMTHISDPDTWFATHYKDHRQYGTKAQQYEPLERLLDEFADVPWIAAHMAGDPEHLEHLQQLLDRHPNLYLDTSATKWMVRELSKHPRAFYAFCQRNPGRILFGSDIVASPDPSPMATSMSFDLLASRYWALRTLYESDYEGDSPIVDPDLPLVDPSLPADAAPMLRGARFDPVTLAQVYHQAAERLLQV